MSDSPGSGPSKPVKIDSRAPRASQEVVGRAPKTAPKPRTATDLVDELVILYRDQIKRVLNVELDDSPTALAFVDHHLRSAMAESRTPILALLAASAGAYYGEIVRREMGGTWIGDGKDPRRLRLLLDHQFIYFSPVDQALEAILGEPVDLDDPRLGDTQGFDSAFRLRPVPQDDDGLEDTDEAHEANWLRARLSEVPPVPEDQLVSLTCRFETLALMLEMLATRQAAAGQKPKVLRVEDYVAAMAARANEH